MLIDVVLQLNGLYIVMVYERSLWFISVKKKKCYGLLDIIIVEKYFFVHIFVL